MKREPKIQVQKDPETGELLFLPKRIKRQNLADDDSDFDGVVVDDDGVVVDLDLFDAVDDAATGDAVADGDGAGEGGG